MFGDQNTAGREIIFAPNKCQIVRSDVRPERTKGREQACDRPWESLIRVLSQRTEILALQRSAPNNHQAVLIGTEIAEIPKSEVSPGFTTSNSSYKSNSISIGGVTFLTNDSRLRVRDQNTSQKESQIS
ncbi:unnamed protein product [Hymenolepis diminuta]|uniref:Uncharacterized protein n=1 Tax=Hymenolepis diminuta TaxID=6216 RepID=A0A564YQW6_HYMDI|nr:unnamed protein product [Hymenolepis diminuta]